jgi:hypothetical protein
VLVPVERIAVTKRLALLFVLCLLPATAVGLTACGGGDDSEVEEISAAIDETVTTTDPSKCTELMTENFVEQNSNQSGKAALEECEDEAADTSDDPDELTVSAVEIEGSDATAEVAFVGGGFDGQTVGVALVKEDDQWKLDEISGFASYDAEALASTLEERFERISDEITPTQINCIGDLVREADQEQAEELLLSGDSTKFIEFVQVCE